MKVLFWQWNAFMQKGMEKALEKLNIEYDTFYQVPTDWESDVKLERGLRQALQRGGKLEPQSQRQASQALQQDSAYDVVLSVNYCPVVSNVCLAAGVRYISWVYDSPIHIRDISSFDNACNSIYFFDRGQVQYYQKKGYKNVYYLPLAADETVFGGALGGMAGNMPMAGGRNYSSDIAFVGQLYKSDFDYLLGPLPMYERGLLNGIITAQSKLYGVYFLDEMIDETLMERLNENYLSASKGSYSVKQAELEYTCACEITSRERFMALSLLAKRHKVNLYSGDKDTGIAGINKYGYVDYYTQMPEVFRSAKINLNISLKTIRTGIPLRIIDVLSCGGFLITNYQEELLEYFVPGEDIVIYNDIPDLVQKCDFYLKNDALRQRIAANGQSKVRELFNFEDKIKKLLSI